MYGARYSSSLCTIIGQPCTLSITSSPISISSQSRCNFALIEKPQVLQPYPLRIPIRCKTTSSGYSLLNDPERSSNLSNLPREELFPFYGRDYEHWLIFMDFHHKPTEQEAIKTYVNTLAQVLGSEEEAKKKIYSVYATPRLGFGFGFGAFISEELSQKVKGLSGVEYVLPDSYIDVDNKDYGGDLFIEGKVIKRVNSCRGILP